MRQTVLSFSHEQLAFTCVYSPPQCSAAGTGWCRRGRGWRWWCGRSWRGSGPTGNPGSRRPAFLKPTPKGRERRKKDRHYQVDMFCEQTASPAVTMNCQEQAVFAKPAQPLEKWQPTYTNWQLHVALVYWRQYRYTSQPLADNPALSRSTWTAWAFRLQLWKRPEVKTGGFIK